ncbi:hypothetical protein SAMN05892883_3629 [Jatrophihabitans sp. GAS493]|nr:DUF3052 domain-containing protein [Jatrophihabitans sp. GAS493]SOD74443.1 hypothetical protein SAMN05892883_3629 [Jatrophihabitans sp. GAS493]
MTTPPASGDDALATSANPRSTPDVAERLGISPGMIVQELGWDDDVDPELRDAIEARTGEEMVDEDSDEVVDVVVLWYRYDDGDLVDALVDAIAPLADNGFIWLLTPKRGRDGYVEPSEIAEAAPTAGLSQTSLASIGPDWAGARLATRRSRPAERR